MSSDAPDIPGLVHVQPLGSGGYADVYLYEQQMPRMPVAVKVLKSDGMTAAIRRQFSEEADTMAQLADHPYIVQVFLSGTAGDGRPYLVMKYYPPPNLAARARSERFTVEEVLRTGISLSSAVETAHRAGVIHRDIKPANVLVSQYGAPGLTDFGIAGRGRAAAEDHDDEVGVSVPWAPPEVLFGHSNGGPRSDIYSLAATLWQLLVGRSPFEVPGGDNSAYALMPRIRSTPVPSTGRADVPTSLERLLAQAMAKDENARPETALAFARALQEIEQEQRFPRTAIVVLDEQGHTTVAESGRSGADDLDQTRVRAPRRVTGPQRPVAAAPVGTRPPLSGGTSIPSAGTVPVRGATAPAAARPATAAPGAVDEGTVRVRRGEAPVEAAPSEPGGSVTISPMVLLGVIGALVVGLVAVVLVVVNGGDGSSPPPATPRTLTAEPQGDQLLAPAVPELTAGSVVGAVDFRWIYPGQRPGDTYLIRVAPDQRSLADAQVRTVKESTFSAKGTKGTQQCAQVRVNRQGSLSYYSDVKCEKAR